MSSRAVFPTSSFKGVLVKCPVKTCSLWVWVIDKVTRKSLPGAKIIVTGPTNKRGQLPKKGVSTFDDLKPGTFQVTGSAVELKGYKTSTASSVSVTIAAGETQFATIEVDLPVADIALHLVDQQDLPVTSETYVLTDPNEVPLQGTLSTTGSRRIQKIRPAGDCKIGFPQLDDGIWEFVESAPGTNNPPPPGDAVTPAAVTLPASYTVAAGDCINSIGYRAGIPIDRIWTFAQNQKLKALRKDPGVLLPGDKVAIPPKRTVRTETKAVALTHKFRRKETLKEYRMQVLMGEHPREDVTCEVEVDGKKAAVTQAGSWISFKIRPDAKEAVVKASFVQAKKLAKQLIDTFEYKIKLGYLCPVDTPEGQEDRLRGLGYYDSLPVAGTPTLEEMLKLFQLSHGILPADGKANTSTVKKLKELTGDPI